MFLLFLNLALAAGTILIACLVGLVVALTIWGPE